MTALTAYDMAHRGHILETEACAVLNRHATRLGEQLADTGGESEPEPDLTLLWATSTAAHARRPYDKRYRVLNGSPYYIRRSGSR